MLCRRFFFRPVLHTPFDAEGCCYYDKYPNQNISLTSAVFLFHSVEKRIGSYMLKR